MFNVYVFVSTFHYLYSGYFISFFSHEKHPTLSFTFANNILSRHFKSKSTFHRTFDITRDPAKWPNSLKLNISFHGNRRTVSAILRQPNVCIEIRNENKMDAIACHALTDGNCKK